MGKGRKIPRRWEAGGFPADLRCASTVSSHLLTVCTSNWPGLGVLTDVPVCVVSRDVGVCAPMYVGTIPGHQLKGRNQVDFYHLALQASELLMFARVSMGTPY